MSFTTSNIHVDSIYAQSMLFCLFLIVIILAIIIIKNIIDFSFKDTLRIISYASKTVLFVLGGFCLFTIVLLFKFTLDVVFLSVIAVLVIIFLILVLISEKYLSIKKEAEDLRDTEQGYSTVESFFEDSNIVKILSHYAPRVLHVTDIIKYGNPNPEKITAKALRARINRLLKDLFLENGERSSIGTYGIVQEGEGPQSYFTFSKLSDDEISRRIRNHEELLKKYKRFMKK